MGHLLYRCFVFCYPLVARLLGLFQPKAKAWVDGRRQQWQHIERSMAGVNRPVVWMHCASVGEFEQGLPLLQALKTQCPQHFYVLSFFSPSGYQHFHQHPLADRVFYLPMDSPAAAKKWLALVQPQLALFVKYEFWYYYLKALHQQNIPTLLVSGIFRSNQIFFQWYGGFYRRLLSFFKHSFVQDQDSAQLLNQIGLQQHSLAGDTRFERVMEIAARWTPVPGLDSFCADHPVWVMGSTWPSDDHASAVQHLVKAAPQLRFVVAPHELDPQRLAECLRAYPNAVLYSAYMTLSETEKKQAPYRSLVVDQMGLLSRLYRYGQVAFVGGGYDKEGVHNTLEAAVYGIPLCFGPVYDKYKEAVDLVAQGAALTESKGHPMEQKILQLVEDPVLRASMGQKAKAFVSAGAGATATIMAYIQEKRLLTK